MVGGQAIVCACVLRYRKCKNAVQNVLTSQQYATVGEGLNKHLKNTLDLRSSLRKVVETVALRETWEEARCHSADSLDEVSYRNMGTYASLMVPEIAKIVHELLTAHGEYLFLKQVQASAKYRAVACKLHQDAVPLDSNLDSASYHDLVDLPRYQTLEEVVAACDLRDINYTAFVVNLNHTIEAQTRNPHFVVLKNGQSTDCCTDFLCTCGSSVKIGIPCRHFWAVLISVPGVAGFHMGMINDLWFKVAQPSLSTLKIFSYSSSPTQEQLEIEFNRPLFNGKPGEASPVSEEELQATQQRLSRQRTFGKLLGMANKVVEASVEEDCVDALEEVLQSFLPGAPSKPEGVSNPPVAKAKGRPKNSKNGSCASLVVSSNKRQRCSGERSQPFAATASQSQASALPRSGPRCSGCGVEGHNVRTCPGRAARGEDNEASVIPSTPAPAPTPTPTP